MVQISEARRIILEQRERRRQKSIQRRVELRKAFPKVKIKIIKIKVKAKKKPKKSKLLSLFFKPKRKRRKK